MKMQWSSEETITLFSKEMAEYSSGITDVQPAVFERDEEKYYCVVFHLAHEAVKEEIMLNGRKVKSEETGGYIAILPKDGEFNCEFGEIEGNNCWVLHKDSFCMK